MRNERRIAIIRTDDSHTTSGHLKPDFSGAERGDVVTVELSDADGFVTEVTGILLDYYDR